MWTSLGACDVMPVINRDRLTAWMLHYFDAGR